MRIAYVCADRGVNPAGAGGSSTHVRELVRSLVQRGHDVTVFLSAAEGAADVLPCPVVDLQADAETAVLHARIQKAAHVLGDGSRAPREAQALLLNQSLAAGLESLSPAPDVVYERQALWSVAGLQFARRRGIPHLLEVNAPLVEQQRDYRELELVAAATGIEDTLLERSDRILVTSPALVGHARAHGASRRSVRVVPCGVPASLLAAQPRAGAGHDPSRFVIGFLGSLKPWHGLDVLVRAFRKLRPADSGYRLLVVGDGPLREEVEGKLHEHRLDAFAELTGNVDARGVAAALARMDVGVAPYPDLVSFYFSPLKLWEYAGAGVPIVASDTGDVASVFPHRSAALLHPPGSASKLAAQITKLRDDPALASRLARRARQIARGYTWDRIAARVERIAADAIRAKAARSDASGTRAAGG